MNRYPGSLSWCFDNLSILIVVWLSLYSLTSKVQLFYTVRHWIHGALTISLYSSWFDSLYSWSWFRVHVQYLIPHLVPAISVSLAPYVVLVVCTLDLVLTLSELLIMVWSLTLGTPDRGLIFDSLNSWSCCLICQIGPIVLNKPD